MIQCPGQQTQHAPTFKFWTHCCRLSHAMAHMWGRSAVMRFQDRLLNNIPDVIDFWTTSLIAGEQFYQPWENMLLALTPPLHDDRWRLLKAAWANGCRMQMLEYRPSNDSPWKHIPVTTVHFLCDRTLEMRIPTHPKTQTTHVLQHLTEVCTSIK